MTQLSPFCPHCQAYFPAGARCRACGSLRLPIETAPAPGAALWQAEAPAAVASRMALAQLDGQAVLAVPWNTLPQPGHSPAPASGVTLLRAGDGGVIWTQRFPYLLEGGVAHANGRLLVGLGLRGMGAGQGWALALDLASGEELWRHQLGGGVRAAPLCDGGRVYLTTSEGALYCLELENGRPLWRTPVYPAEAHLPAMPVVVREHGVLQAILVGSYGGLQGWEEGKIVALDERGRKLWEQSARGNVRGAPTVAEGIVYVSAFRNGPSTGVLSAFDARTGRPVWKEPFTVRGQPSDKHSFNFSTSPLVEAGKVYVGSLNHTIYILDAADGAPLQAVETPGAVTTSLAWLEDLVIFGTNLDRKSGFACALDPQTGKLAWELDLGAACLTDPLVEGGAAVFFGATNGRVAALAWHAGQYSWAAQRLEHAGKWQPAGDCRALEGHYQALRPDQDRAYQQAEADWTQAGEPERAARLWEALDRREQAARTYLAAGQRWRMHAAGRAAAYFERAARLFFNLRRREELNEATGALAACAGLPALLVQGINVGSFIQWEEGELTLRLLNEGRAPVPARVRLWIGGALKTPVEFEIQSPLAAGQAWNLPMKIVPTRPQSTLEVAVEYDTGDGDYPLLRGMFAIPVEAIERPRPLIDAGDVGMIQLTINSTTAEGLKITTRDVGLMKTGGEIGSVHSTGDIGAVSASDGIGQVKADGDIGVVKG